MLVARGKNNRLVLLLGNILFCSEAFLASAAFAFRGVDRLRHAAAYSCSFFRMKVARLKNRSERCRVVPIGRADGRICLGLFSLYWHALMPLRCLGPNPYRSPNELLLQSMFYISNVSNGQRYERPGGRTLENLQPDLLQR